MAVRTIKNKKERQIAIFTNSFISCGARLPIYILFSKIFFPKNTTLVIGFLYLLGIIINLFFSLILAKILKSSKQGQLIIELPPYRLPTFRNVYKQAWFQTSMFLKKAGTIILITVMIIWFLASFPFGVKYGSEFSLLGKLGRLISPLFKPLGFGHFSFAVALVFGLVAKEVVVSTLGALYGLGANGLTAVLPNYLNPAGALAFLVFSLLYIPCLATIAVIKKETNSLKFTFIQILTTIITAWIISFIVYKTALLFS
jgi:ferrous iron transport protein B